MRAADFATAPPPLVSAPLWLDKLEHVSAFSMAMLSRCPRQFCEHYLLGKKERPGAAGIVGSAFHGTMEKDMAQKVTSGGNLNLGTKVEFYHDKSWPDAIKKVGG